LSKEVVRAVTTTPSTVVIPFGLTARLTSPLSILVVSRRSATCDASRGRVKILRFTTLHFVDHSSSDRFARLVAGLDCERRLTWELRTLSVT
jgi:hypothetical protein